MIVRNTQNPNNRIKARHFVAGPSLRRLFCGFTLRYRKPNNYVTAPYAGR